MEQGKIVRYQNDPTIGPLVAQYQLSTAALNQLKGGLRDNQNIDEIIQVSEHQAAVRRRLSHLIGVKEQERRRETLHSLSLAVGAGLLVVGFVNLGFFLGWWHL